MVFPDDAKIASVIPLGIKDELVLGLDKYFSPFISAYRKGYSTQHVLTRLVEEWRERLDNNYIVGAILMDLSKAFDCINYCQIN